MDFRRRLHRRHSRNDPGHAHVLTFSCYQRYRFLSAERTCLWLVESIEWARTALKFSLWAYVFMPEHVHLLIHPREHVYDLGTIRQAIKEPVGRRAVAYVRDQSPDWLPRITRRRGGRVERLFWQSGGGFETDIAEASTLQAAIDYIHLNPVRRRLAERASDWRWSSAGWYDGAPLNDLSPDPIPQEWCSG